MSKTEISTSGLKILQEQNLKELSLRYAPNIDFQGLSANCLNEKTKSQTLNLLDLTGSLKPSAVVRTHWKSSADETEMSATVKDMIPMKNLTVLKVGFTTFDDPSLAVVGENLKKLQVLDISGTEVANIDAVGRLNELRALV